MNKRRLAVGLKSSAVLLWIVCVGYCIDSFQYMTEGEQAAGAALFLLFALFNVPVILMEKRVFFVDFIKVVGIIGNSLWLCLLVAIVFLTSAEGSGFPPLRDLALGGLAVLTPVMTILAVSLARRGRWWGDEVSAQEH